MLKIFTSVKIQRLRPGLNPQTWVQEASMLTTRPPKLSKWMFYYARRSYVVYIYGQEAYFGLVNRKKYHMEIKDQLDATDWLFYSKTYCSLNMFRAPLCPSSGALEYYTSGCCLWYLVLWFSSCWYGVELRVVRPVCGLQPANWTHNPCIILV